ncbi:MAG TPA: nitrogen fixation protein NifQ [Candidatus Competibacteraceae bacterium]|nr:nitrogen fixation protein NifQ [Candidatus Competibacteraceae bacterium]MCP5134309.1 nitrogen fixation protein NifQ [Gammaproteobacteria bacterium]HPF58204.1 nitrogen fixation protein NifQ [Candidatus Competibacteraceae bacterium]HRY17130.1 nitrogen fixation protein NifQ [Candidatus Competibacteraceae bacterium]
MEQSLRLESLALSAGTDPRREVYDFLMSHCHHLPNDDTLARMLATQAVGGGSLPVGLGLKSEAFNALLARHFPNASPLIMPPRFLPQWDSRLVEELDELVKLLELFQAGRDLSEQWLSVIVATGCMANDHLWQDLGLWSRRDLSDLMARNFPALAAKNDHDMKWKKFLYKQLCVQEGVYLCRAPSCAVCCDYARCFGPEE